MRGHLRSTAPRSFIAARTRIRQPVMSYMRFRAGQGRWTTICTSWRLTWGLTISTITVIFRSTPLAAALIIDYRGQIVGRQEYGGVSTYVAGVIDVEAMR